MAKEYWTVDTEAVRRSAQKVSELIGNYETEYGKLYTATTELRGSRWTGVASDQFNSKLESYKQSFEELKAVLNNYYEFLIEAANAYEATENAVQSDANTLSTGA